MPVSNIPWPAARYDDIIIPYQLSDIKIFDGEVVFELFSLSFSIVFIILSFIDECFSKSYSYQIFKDSCSSLCY